MVKTFSKRSDALEWSRVMEVKADRRDLPMSVKSLEHITIADIIKRYIKEICINKKSYDTESVTLHAFTRTKLAQTKLSQVSASDFYKYRDQRSKTIKPASINRELCVIKHAFSVAIDKWDIPLKTNPLAKVKKLKVNNARNRRIHPNEIEALYSAITKRQNVFIMPIFELALETAMRRGEILNITKQDINFDQKTLYIPDTKNGYPRTIPLTDKAIEVLYDAINRQNGQIFPITANALRLAWAKLTKRAGITDLHFHDLRHEAISRFFERGLSIPEVALISGHRDYRMLARYTHLKAEDIARKL
tara:strand:+ start:347 stop:1261 length:915 start_codon:yes stop_codon:yes gene_type:complete